MSQVVGTAGLKQQARWSMANRGNSARRAMTCIIWLLHASLGCHQVSPCCNPKHVSNALGSRIGVEPAVVPPRSTVIPDGVVFEDGLGEGEAVATGLANNSLFQAALAQLGMLGGDAVQASLLANPQVNIYFPTAHKEGQYTIYGPIESYFLRPARVKVAKREYWRVGEQLVQNGLNVARDIRFAYIDWALARAQTDLAQESLVIRQGIADITRRRFENGEISELETIASQVDLLNANALFKAQHENIYIAEAKLRTVLGIPELNLDLVSQGLLFTPIPGMDEQSLVDTALACRPDHHAATWTVSAAAERANLSRWLFWRLDGVVDTRTGPYDLPSRVGGGMRFDLPIFNRNQGGRLRADAELAAALHTRDAIKDSIYQEVRTAYHQLQQASLNLEILETEIIPKLSQAIAIAEKGFADGGTDYLMVYQTTTQYLDARSRALDQTAMAKRAMAELERSVSRSLDAPPLDVQQMIEDTTSMEISLESLVSNESR